MPANPVLVRQIATCAFGLLQLLLVERLVLIETSLVILQFLVALFDVLEQACSGQFVGVLLVNVLVSRVRSL